MQDYKSLCAAATICDYSNENISIRGVPVQVQLSFKTALR